MNVGIVIPSWKYFANPFKLQPLWEMHFATVVDTAFGGDVNVELIDMRDSRKGIDVKIPKCDIYFYWVMKTADYPEVVDIVCDLRIKFPDSRHVGGGTHVEISQDEASNVFDTVIIGPGEVICDIIIDENHGRKIKCADWYEWNKCQFNDFPFPDRKFIEYDKDVNNELFEKYGGPLATSVMFSRGCSFKCAYCAYNVPDKMQRRSIQSIIGEVRYLKALYDIKAINIRDEICIPQNQFEAVRFFHALKSENIIWRGQTRVSKHSDLLVLAADSGCVELAIGVESASQECLNIVNKGQSVDLIKEYFKACKQNNIKTKMCLVIGLPGEPSNILDLTKDFIRTIDPDYVNISGLCPMPGSDIYDNSDKYDIEFLDKDFSKYFHLMYRFGDEENFGIPFKYKENTRWGKSFTRDEIMNNIKELQHYCKELGKVY